MVAHISASTQLSQLLSSFSTYQSQFTQQTYAGGHSLQQAKGRVWIARPGKFRWQIMSPSQQLIIVNGKTVWNYDADLLQATKTTLTSQQNMNAAFLLSGQVTSLITQFAIKRVTKSSKQLVFSLTPTRPMSFEKIQLSFNGKLLTAMKTYNSIGQVTQFNFTHIKINQPITDAKFTFSAPKGVDVLSQ